MEFLTEYAIAPIALICCAIGFIIKHLIKAIPNKFIPLILAGFGLFFNCWFNGWTIDWTIALTGLGSGLVATGGFEAVKHLIPTAKPKDEAPAENEENVQENTQENVQEAGTESKEE